MIVDVAMTYDPQRVVVGGGGGGGGEGISTPRTLKENEANTHGTNILV